MKRAVADIGAKVDILINTAEVHRAHGIASSIGVDIARAEMDVNYFGLLRLAQEFSADDAVSRRGRPTGDRRLGEPAVRVRAQQLSAASGRSPLPRLRRCRSPNAFALKCAAQEYA